MNAYFPTLPKTLLTSGFIENSRTVGAFDLGNTRVFISDDQVDLIQFQILGRVTLYQVTFTIGTPEAVILAAVTAALGNK